MNTYQEVITYVLNQSTNYSVEVDKPALIKVSSDDGRMSYVLAAFKEPITKNIPINGMWLNVDESSANYGQLLRRTGLTTDGTHVHSWQAVSTFEDIFSVDDVWVGKDLPALYDNYKTEIQATQTMINNVFNYMNQRLNVNRANIQTNRNDIDKLLDLNLDNIPTIVNEHTLSIEALEALGIEDAMLAVQTVNNNQTTLLDEILQRLGLAESKLDGLPGIETYKHIQEEPSEVWVLSHYLDGTDFVCKFENAEGEPCLPISHGAENENTYAAYFAVPVTGRAVIIKV